MHQRAVATARRIAAQVGTVGGVSPGWGRRVARRLRIGVAEMSPASPVRVAVLHGVVLVRAGEGDEVVLAGVVSVVTGGRPDEVRAVVGALVAIFLEQEESDEKPVSSVG